MIPNEHDEEHQRLEQIAADSWYAKGANAVTIRYCAEVFARFFRGTRCLELGPAEGVMTGFLVEQFPEMTVVDGSAAFCSDLSRRHPRIEVVNSLFETYEPQARFDTIVLGHVLEHVEDPVGILTSVRGWLAPGGVVLAAVPNARSVHREAAVLMGLLGTVHDLNETDVHHGHRRVYDPAGLHADFEAAGLRVASSGGYWLKPLSNRQIEEWFSSEMLDAFMALGERFPDIAGEIYVVAEG